MLSRVELLQYRELPECLKAKPAGLWDSKDTESLHSTAGTAEGNSNDSFLEWRTRKRDDRDQFPLDRPYSPDIGWGHDASWRNWSSTAFSHTPSYPDPLTTGAAKWLRASSDADDVEITRRKVFALLNKLTRENFASICPKLWAIPIPSRDVLQATVNMVFDKAVLEAQYSEMYADLCLHLHEKYPVFPGKEGRSPVSFLSCMLNKCHREFRRIPKTLGEDAVFEKLGVAVEMFDGPADAKIFVKKKLGGLIKMIALLFLRDLIPHQVIREVALRLVFREESPASFSLDLFAVLLKNVGATLDAHAVGHQYMDAFFERIADILAQGRCQRERFLLEDLVCLREAHWIIDQLKFQGEATTKDVIRQNAMEEELGIREAGRDYAVAGLRPQYIKDNMVQEALRVSRGLRPVDENEASEKDGLVDKLVGYFMEDGDAASAVTDWRNLGLSDAEYTMAVVGLLVMGMYDSRKGDAILKLLDLLKDVGVTTDVLKEARQKVHPQLEDALADNPKCKAFDAALGEMIDLNDGFITVVGKKSRRSPRAKGNESPSLKPSESPKLSPRYVAPQRRH